jgi:hypothetical protein
VDRLAERAVLVRVAAILELLQRPVCGRQLDDLEFKQPDPRVELERQIDAAELGGVLGCEVQAQCREMAVENAGIVALVVGDGVGGMRFPRNFVFQG